MGITNNTVEHHIDALFGEIQAKLLRAKITTLTPARREILIIENVCQSLKNLGAPFVLPFCFKDATGSRTSHYLIFASKHVLGYTIMKEIMAKTSSTREQGVASFSYCAADETMPFLFEFQKPLDALEEILLDNFSGKSLRMIDIFDQHHVDRPYIKKNYKNALLSLEKKQKIVVTPANRRAGTFGDDVCVTFPG